jgi:hypothetical protein
MLPQDARKAYDAIYEVMNHPQFLMVPESLFDNAPAGWGKNYTRLSSGKRDIAADLAPVAAMLLTVIFFLTLPFWISPVAIGVGLIAGVGVVGSPGLAIGVRMFQTYRENRRRMSGPIRAEQVYVPDASGSVTLQTVVVGRDAPPLAPPPPPSFDHGSARLESAGEGTLSGFIDDEDCNA